LARDPRISEIFYYFEEHTTLESGRTMGRKIGVVQEILVKKHILGSPVLRDSVVYEQSITGRSGASHKVEFVLFQPIGAAVLSPGERVDIPGTPFSVKLESIDLKARRAKFAAKIGIGEIRGSMTEGEMCPMKVRTAMTEHRVQFRLSEVREGRARFAILEAGPPRATVESKRVGAQRFKGSDNLGRGIQSIEKAKQASLVAIDYDLAFNKSLLALTGRKTKRPYRSFVVLGNGVHWKPNDLAVLDTYVDFTYLAQDAGIIRYAEFVRQKAEAAGEEFKDYFMSYFEGMTKTPPDSFTVSAADFVALAPKGAPPLIDMLLAQISKYPTVSTSGRS
jgi:hypothetical protein